MDATCFETPVYCVLCFETEPIEAADALGNVMCSPCDGVGCTRHAHDDPHRDDWGGPACTRCYLRELQDHADEFNCVYARRLLRAATPAKREHAAYVRNQWKQMCKASHK